MRTWLAILTAIIVATTTATRTQAQEPTPPDGQPAPAPAAEPEGEFDPMALTSLQFLNWARRPPVENSWAIMKGTITHRAERKNHVVPVQFRARMDPRRIIGQVQIDEVERYGVSQVFADGAKGTTVLQERAAPEGRMGLRDFGLRPTDLTLSFLYWEFVEELEPTRIATRRARVFRLRHVETGETVDTAIDLKALFPLRAEWTLKGADEPYRKLEFKAFLQRDGILIPSRARLSNSGWKTDLHFTDITLERVTEETPIPEDLFIIDAE